VVDLVIRGRRVLTAEGIGPAAVHVDGERIVQVAGHDAVPSGARLVEAGDAVVMPGLVDTHVHMNDPGRADWEGFGHATRAAAAGGVTTVVDMPLNSLPPTTTVAALLAKRAAAAGRCHVDVGFWGGVVPGNLAALPALVDAGVLGCKAFLADSGVEEFPPVELPELEAAMAALAARDVPTLVHAEAPGPLAAVANEV
jgi:allantoinase